MCLDNLHSLQNSNIFSFFRDSGSRKSRLMFNSWKSRQLPSSKISIIIFRVPQIYHAILRTTTFVETWTFFFYLGSHCVNVLWQSFESKLMLGEPGFDIGKTYGLPVYIFLKSQLHLLNAKNSEVSYIA
jgi:hypothetical protein